ncbi:hypothetical protein D3C77_318700 [compost metagenome]
MLVLFFGVQQTVFRQPFHDIQIAVFHEAAGEIRYFIRIVPLCVDNADELDSILTANSVVVFTMSRSHMNNPCTAGIRNKVCP